MLRLPRLLVVLVLGLAWLPTSGAGEKESKGEKVHFLTADGVDLHGVFYPGKFNLPTVLLLHSLGEDSKKKGWVHLAEELHKRGWAVLAFDFRGHGLSKELLEPKLFWSHPLNQNMKGPKGPQVRTIDYDNFNPGYYPVLVNDIAAARAFLDRQNDLKVCNSANLILVGADTGATLGAVWLSAEWTRYRCKPPPPNVPAHLVRLVAATETPEGNDVISCVWLTISPKLGDFKAINLPLVLNVPAKEKAVPMIFVHGEGDKKAGEFARMLESKLVVYTKKDKKERDDRYRYTAAIPVPNTKLPGSDLLNKSLPTAEDISKYLKEVYELKRNDYDDRLFQKTPYAWKTGVGGLMPANKLGEKTLSFKDYRPFIR